MNVPKKYLDLFPIVAALFGAAYIAWIRTGDFVPLYQDWLQGKVPYGVLWTWLNPLYWTDLPYRAIVISELVLMTAVNWLFVRKGRMTRLMFWFGLFTSMMWMSTGVYQNVSVTMFGPLSSVYPPLVLLLVLQKLPVLWSWPPWANAHWQCAFNGTQPASDLNTGLGLQCTLPSVRWDLSYPWVYSYFIVAFWVVWPLSQWLLHRYRD